jgi:hypothetical protein
MPRLISTSCGIICAAAVLGGASQKPSSDLQVTLKFIPQENLRANTVALPPSIIDRALALRVLDSRETTDPRIIGTGTNDDDLPFPIRATTDVEQFVRESVKQLAASQALKESGSPAERVLQLRLIRFNVNESNKAVGSTYAAEVHFAYTLFDGQGRALTEGATAGTADTYGRARSGTNCAEVLSDALKDAFTRTIGSPVLQQAWMSGQPTPSAARPAGGQPAAVMGTVEERLKALDDLLKRGVITEEEHATRRAAILKEL